MKGKTANLDPELVMLLVEFERVLSMELNVVSGQRGAEHNRLSGGVKHSEHTYQPLAKGADVLCKQSTTRYKMLKAAFFHRAEQLIPALAARAATGSTDPALPSRIEQAMRDLLARVGVRRLGIGSTFLHLGVADDKPQDVAWHYYEDYIKKTIVVRDA